MTAQEPFSALNVHGAKENSIKQNKRINWGKKCKKPQIDLGKVHWVFQAITKYTKFTILAQNYWASYQLQYNHFIFTLI